MNRQNNKTERKKTISDTLFTAFMLFTATAVSFCFFHLGNKNSANITVIYTLALILTALKTSGYVYGIEMCIRDSLSPAFIKVSPLASTPSS